MARPLRSSLAEFIQFLGRGLRISPDTGKVDCLVLDHSGNCARFWSEFQHFFENGWDQLDKGTKAEQPKPEERAEPEPIKCPVCGHLHKPRPVCPQCGHEYPKKSAVEHVPGTLKELLAGGNQATITREVWPQVCAYARQKRPGDEVAAKKMALALYRDLANAWPGRDFERTKDAPITPEVASKIRSVQIRFQKRRDKAKRQAVAA